MSAEPSARERIEGAIAPLKLDGEAAKRLERLLDALAAEPHAATAVRDPERALDMHLLDSLSGLEVGAIRDAARIVDVGAGAGFPGLPLAAALSATRVDLVEARGRRAEAMARLASAAGLDNAHAVSRRAEEWAAAEGWEVADAVTARAVGPLALLVEYAAPLLRLGGALVAWKGMRDPAEEEGGRVAGVATGLAPSTVLAVTPFPGARHLHLHVYRKIAPTPAGFPRRVGAAAKRPLG